MYQAKEQILNGFGSFNHRKTFVFFCYFIGSFEVGFPAKLKNSQKIFSVLLTINKN